jgi:murein L,D-transpeptidase YafK
MKEKEERVYPMFILQSKVMAFILLFLTGSSVFASENGDKIISRIPDAFVSFGSGQGPEYAIVVEKERQKLFLYTRDGSYREMYRMEASTGKGAGAKLQEGDAKTPEGVRCVSD